jgi:membrane-associated phospholipid phosphatase
LRLSSRNGHRTTSSAFAGGAGGPAYRWNEIAIGELLEHFVTLPLAAHHLALLHVAIDDAVATAWQAKRFYKRRGPARVVDTAWIGLARPYAPSYPSDFAAAAAAAAEVLAYLFPDRASAFNAKAEEAMRTRLLAGVEYPSDVAAGRELGRKVAALAIEHGKRDGSDRKWAGSVPDGPGKWKGTNPIAPQAATWQTWVLAMPDALRPPPPPAHDSDRIRADLAEIRSFKRTPKSNHTAMYWEVFGGTRAYALWNEHMRVKLLEYAREGQPVVAARSFAMLNVALHDAAVACWDAKYAYWMIRPSHLDATVQTVFPPPNHPSYPSAHGCLSTAAAAVLARLFPRDAETLVASGKQAAEARIWAGIHYRIDIDVGQALGQQVAEHVLARSGLGN